MKFAKTLDTIENFVKIFIIFYIKKIIYGVSFRIEVINAKNELTKIILFFKADFNVHLIYIQLTKIGPKLKNQSLFLYSKKNI